MKRTTYIYGIKDLEIDKFIYAGKSNVPSCRFEGHISGRGNEGVRKQAEEKGRDSFQIETLEAVEYEVSRDWVARERFWVKKLRKEGHPLCNKNNGGGGVTEHTEETKAKLSKPASEEHKAKISKALTGRELPEEHKANISKALKGKPKSEGHKAKIRSYSQSEERRAELSKARSGEGNPMYGKKRPECSKRMSGENNPMYGKSRSEKTKVSIGRAHAKPYPAFYNVKTEAFISAGCNLAQMCREHSLSCGVMGNLKTGVTERSSKGWQLAGASGIGNSGGVIT